MSASLAAPPTTFGLVIGINEYQSQAYPNLTAAVADADRFDRYLKTGLGADPENIINLRDRDATRQAIIDAFVSLTNNPKINKDDPIVIYFAGHGGRVKKPKSWSDWPTTSPQIEILCPTDMGGDGSLEGAQPSAVTGIPDRTIAKLLHDLSQAKGDNIVSSTLLGKNIRLMYMMQ